MKMTQRANYLRPLPPEVLRALQSFLEEDIRSGDLTTQALGPLDTRATGTVFARSRSIVAGIAEAVAIAEMRGLSHETLAFEGNWVEPGDVVLRLHGAAGTLLTVERVILNIMMRMSGIATKTYRLVERVREIAPHVRVAATRKTTPGFRFFEKSAVVIGGGDPHRYALDDMVLIKNNHITAVGGIGLAVRTAREYVSFSRKVSCEVRGLDEAIEAVEAGADIVLLDNLPPREIERIVETLKDRGLRERVVLEASGGITEENVEEYAVTGVDVISIGSLTHSYVSADFNMRLSF
ncbi:MAG: carboxylating nicotinate-nucleotide diphosphorylase [Candidatus Thorarchaeota archaeon]